MGLCGGGQGVCLSSCSLNPPPPHPAPLSPPPFSERARFSSLSLPPIFTPIFAPMSLLPSLFYLPLFSLPHSLPQPLNPSPHPPSYLVRPIRERLFPIPYCLIYSYIIIMYNMAKSDKSYDYNLVLETVVWLVVLRICVA